MLTSLLYSIGSLVYTLVKLNKLNRLPIQLSIHTFEDKMKSIWQIVIKKLLIFVYTSYIK